MSLRDALLATGDDQAAKLAEIIASAITTLLPLRWRPAPALSGWRTASGQSSSALLRDLETPPPMADRFWRLRAELERNTAGGSP
jgi:hypothetical protein